MKILLLTAVGTNSNPAEQDNLPQGYFHGVLKAALDIFILDDKWTMDQMIMCNMNGVTCGHEPKENCHLRSTVHYSIFQLIVLV